MFKLTNREMINNTNIADFLKNINRSIPYTCIIECIDPTWDVAKCYEYSKCIDCISDWLNSEVKTNNE